MNEEKHGVMREEGTPGRRRKRRVALKRGLPLLPSVFTSGNLFCGFLSVVWCLEGRYENAALMILLAGVLDILDGGIARLTDTESPFGLQYDSLADVISFGLAPALLADAWALRNLPRLGWSIAFLFVACTAVRLARFNVQSGTVDRRWFIGLPSPVAAGFIAALVFAYPSGPLENAWALTLIVSLVGLLAFLMVSRIRFRSLKDVDLRRRRPHQVVLIVVTALVIASVAPRLFVLTVAVAYVSYGLVLRLAQVLPDPARQALPAQLRAAARDPEMDEEPAHEAADEA